MGSRHRRPGRNSGLVNPPVPDYGQVWAGFVKEEIEKLDFTRYDESLRRVHAHPKNLLRLNNRRIQESRDSKRNSSNIASFHAATRRSMNRR